VRIGIDARELCGHPTGVGRYLQGLLSAWADDDATRRHEFILYAHEPLSIPLDSRRFLGRTLGGPAGTWWEQFKLPRAVRADHVDVLFSPGYTTPLWTTVRRVVAIHDVSFAAHPEWFTMREGMRRRWLSRQSAIGAAAVITISEFSKTELVERFHLPAGKVHVIPPGVPVGSGPVASGFSRPSTPLGTALSSSKGRTLPTVLFVGSIFNRRHVPDLIRAFADVARTHPDVRLDIVGDNRSHPFEDIDGAIASEHVTERVTWRRYVPDGDLALLYGQARAFAFLSEYEGLGLTPLEALSAGVPPVLLDTPVARESCGAAALYVKAGDRPATVRAIEQLLFDDAVRARILAAAPGALAKYRWPRAAADTLALLEQVGRT
jgi:glycosyltransferase involved in cell wall biosynthesis